MACAWAVLQHLGVDGYKRLTRVTIDTVRRMAAGVKAIDGLTVVAEPEAQIVAITVAPGWEDRMDVFAVGDAMHERGWHHDRQSRPDSLHATVSPGNAPVIEEYLADLRDCVDIMLGRRAEDRSTSYSTLE